MPDRVGRDFYERKLQAPSIVAVDIAIVRTRPDALSPQFLAHYLNSLTDLSRVNTLSIGTTRKQIRRANTERHLLPVPPIGEQQMIARALDHLNDTIHHTQLECADLQSVRDSVTDDRLRGHVRMVGETGNGS